MRTLRLLVPASVPVALTIIAGLWSCVVESPSSNGGSGGFVAGIGGAGGSGGTPSDGGGGAFTSGTGGGSVCTLDNGTDPVGFCAQQLVLQTEAQVAFDPTRGLAQSWSANTGSLDLGPGLDGGTGVLHVPADDASFGAAVSRYASTAERYGDTTLTVTLQLDLIALVPTLVAELSPIPPGYAGEIYLDLRTASGGLRVASRNDLADQIDAIADAYGRAIYTSAYVTLGSGGALDGGGGEGGGPADAGAASDAGDAGDAGSSSVPPVVDAILGAPSGGATAYTVGDVATGAYALVDMAVRHAQDDPGNALAWQIAARNVLAHLDARARDPQTGLFYAALVTSADPGHDALAPAAPGGPPADALLTDVVGRVTLALLRIQDMVNNNAAVLPALASVPLEVRAEAALSALDATPTSAPLWDASGGPSNGDGGTLGSGYFTGWVPSTGTLLTDKPTRANALLMASFYRAALMGNGPHPARSHEIFALFSPANQPPGVSFLSVVLNQNGFFQQVPQNLDFFGFDAGANPRAESYFSSANAVAVEGLTELWYGLP